MSTSSKDPQQIADKQIAVIVGTGSLAAWIGHELLSADLTTIFCTNRRLADSWSWSLIHSGIEHQHTAPINCRALEESHNIFIATRAHHLQEIWRTYLLNLPDMDGRRIFVCSNGLIEEILECWQRQRRGLIINQAVITAGITRLTASTFKRKDTTGKLYYGPIVPTHTISTHQTTFEQPNLPLSFEYDNDIKNRSRKKWLFNTAANTVAGVFALAKNEQILSQHHNLLRELYDEAFDLACELWPDWQRESEMRPAHREMLWLELRQLLIDTRENENSMAAAVRNKIPDGTQEALFLGGVAFQKRGYPALKYWTRKLLNQHRQT